MSFYACKQSETIKLNEIDYVALICTLLISYLGKENESFFLTVITFSDLSDRQLGIYGISQDRFRELKNFRFAGQSFSTCTIAG